MHYYFHVQVQIPKRSVAATAYMLTNGEGEQSEGNSETCDASSQQDISSGSSGVSGEGAQATNSEESQGNKVAVVRREYAAGNEEKGITGPCKLGAVTETKPRPVLGTASIVEGAVGVSQNNKSDSELGQESVISSPRTEQQQQQQQRQQQQQQLQQQQLQLLQQQVQQLQLQQTHSQQQEQALGPTPELQQQQQQQSQRQPRPPPQKVQHYAIKYFYNYL